MSGHWQALILTMATVAAALFWSTYFAAIDGVWLSNRIRDYIISRREARDDKLLATVVNIFLTAFGFLIVIPIDLMTASYFGILSLRGVTFGLDLNILEQKQPKSKRAVRRQAYFRQWWRFAGWCLIGGLVIGLLIWAFWQWMFPAALVVNYVLLPLFCLPLVSLGIELAAWRKDRANERRCQALLQQVAELSSGDGLNPFLASDFAEVRKAASGQAARLGDEFAVAAIDGRLQQLLVAADQPWQEPNPEICAEISGLTYSLKQIGGPSACAVLRRHFRPREWHSEVQREIWSRLKLCGETPTREAIDAALAGLATPDWQVALKHLRELDAYEEAVQHHAYQRQIGEHVGKLLQTAAYALYRQHESKAYDSATAELNRLDDLWFAQGLLHGIKSRTPASLPNAKGAYLKGGTRIHLVLHNHYATDPFADLVDVIGRRVEKIDSVAAVELLRASFQKPDFPLTEELLSKCKPNRT